MLDETLELLRKSIKLTQGKPLEDYQIYSTQKMLDNNCYGLLLDMGLGKGIISLSAIDILLYQTFEVSKVLVIAPKLVATKTWPDEILAWEHTKHLTVSVVTGDPKQRIAALKAKADIYTIGCDSISWLVSYYQAKWPFDMVVIDESSKFKNPSSQRFKALKKVRPYIERLYILTGTPAPNGLRDLWSQIWLLDEGTRLGLTMTKFTDTFFIPDKRNATTIFNYKLKDKTGEQEIYDKISDICISMKTDDYVKLPERIDRTREITLSAETMAGYKAFEKEQVMELIGGQEITAANAAALMNKLLQYANGAVYDNEQDRSWHLVHDEKLEMLEADIEAANGVPFLLFYQFKHDQARIMERFKHLKPVNVKEDGAIEKWNKGEIPLMLLHAKSGGHGLNLQFGGNLVGWYGVPWSLEEYLQGVKRVHRRGQKHDHVMNLRYLAKGTVDELVMARLDDKSETQDSLLDAVKAYIEKVITS